MLDQEIKSEWEAAGMLVPLVRVVG